MRLSLATLIAASLCLAATASDAAGLSGMGANLFGNYFSFPKPNLQSPPVRKISVGAMRMELQHTRLAEIQKTFGGTIMTQGDGSGAATWLCYHSDGTDAPAANTWFVSNSLGGQEFVMIIAVEEASADKTPGDCEAASAKFRLPDLGIPGLGAKSADLKAKFGASGSGSKVSYRADAPAADALGTAITAQYLGYILKGGTVAAYGVGETAVSAK